MFAIRWKRKVDLSRGSLIHRTILNKNLTTSETVDENWTKKDEAALEIQRHIKGYLTRIKIRPVLLERLANAVKTDNPGSPLFKKEISDVKYELEQEGLEPDEATRLIQQVYRKVSEGRICPLSKNQYSTKEPKTWQEAMVVLNNLMQEIHTNNVNFQTLFKVNKEGVGLDDIKTVQVRT